MCSKKKLCTNFGFYKISLSSKHHTTQSGEALRGRCVVGFSGGCVCSCGSVHSLWKLWSPTHTASPPLATGQRSPPTSVSLFKPGFQLSSAGLTSSGQECHLRPGTLTAQRPLLAGQGSVCIAERQDFSLHFELRWKAREEQSIVRPFESSWFFKRRPAVESPLGRL